MTDLCVATHSHFLFVRLNDQFGIKFVVPLGTDGLYAGIARVDGTGFPENIITACQEVSTPHPFDAPIPSVITHFRLDDIFARCGRARIEHVWDCHQIVHDEGHVYYANTGSNSIVIEDYTRLDECNSPHRREIFFGRSSANNRQDINHINSLLWHEGFLYVVHHNASLGQYSDIYKLDLDGDCHDIVDVWRMPTSGIHDIEIIGNDFYYCDSQRGRLIRYNCIEREITAELVLGGHTKGLEILGDKLLVGVSAFSRLTEIRKDSTSEIAVVNRNEWKVIARPTIQVAEKNVGNINDILVL